MNYTMATEYRLYIDKIQDNTPENILFGVFEESKDFWKNLFAKWNRDIVKEFNELLNELIKPKLITPKERREHFSRFRDVPKDRDYLMSFLQEILDRHKMNNSEPN